MPVFVSLLPAFQGLLLYADSKSMVGMRNAYLENATQKKGGEHEEQ